MLHFHFAINSLGSTRQLVRSNGAVRDHYNYDEFGVPGPGAKLSEDGRNVNHNTFGYTGEMWDEEDDLLYLRSRYYAPHFGRFMTRDVFPGYADNPLSMHKYTYVENSPVNFVDPLGFEKKSPKVQYGPVNPRDLYGPPSKNNLINQGTSETVQRASTVATNRSNNSNTVKLAATDVAWYGANGTIEQGAKLLGRTISSQVGNVYSGVTTAFDVTKTWDNKNYTTGQKITKIAIQVSGGAVVVAGGTVIADLAIGGVAATGGGSLVVGAAGIAGLSSVVNKSQNWLYDQLGLK